MTAFKQIPASTALELMEQENALVADIRDPNSFQNNHIKGAIALTNDNLAEFLEQQDPEQPVIVCCYHGISSQSAAAFLCERGFKQVYSLDGGFEHWALTFPDACEPG